MSKGKRNQQRHVHVNKYAKFSKADGATERILAQQEKDQKEKEDKERDRTIMSGRSWLGFRREPRQYYHINHMNLEGEDFNGFGIHSRYQSYLGGIL